MDLESAWQAVLDFLRHTVAVVLPALRATAGHCLPLLLPLFGVGWLIHLAASVFERDAVSLLGVKGYLYVLGWPGTSVHELGHAVFCPLFGHRISGMKLFSFNPKSSSAGFVSHTFNRRNPWHLAGNFFISVGPLLLGALVVYLLLRFLAGFPLQLSQIYSYGQTIPGPENSIVEGAQSWALLFWKAFRHLWSAVTANLDFKDWRLYLAAWLTLGVGSGMVLSGADIKLALQGLAVILSVLFLTNVVLVLVKAAAPSMRPVIPAAAVLAFLMLLVLCVCTAGAVVFRLLRLVFRR